MRAVRALAAAPAAAAFISTTAAAMVSMNIGSVSGAPGTSVTFQVSLASGGAQVGGVQNTIAFGPATPIASCTLNPAVAMLSGWSLQPKNCTPLVDCSQANFVIAMFGSAIPDGALYQCEVKIAANAVGGHYPLACSGAKASDPAGQILPVECVSGEVEVVPPTPTPTPTPTAIPTPTAALSVSGGGCEVEAGNAGATSSCWLVAGIVLLWRQRGWWRC